ncbi:hypothetical protein EB232_19810 [Mesorhizobium sp. NZP2077]|nr:hypothetical protein EB232_19810 [Mesorhizobium sp. NZP2077]
MVALDISEGPWPPRSWPLVTAKFNINGSANDPREAVIVFERQALQNVQCILVSSRHEIGVAESLTEFRET